MKKYVVTILAALALLALPLAAQVPEENEPIPEQIEEQAVEAQQEIEQEIDEAAQAIDEAAQEVDEFGQELDQAVDESLESEETTTSDDELPRTASPLAALALLGLAGAGSALGLRVARRK
jgi:hypothetical protein